jgi:predicted unusual protein kinase regulating ubiquinone biosynthesis (AarF/ABC1/UbiB family)
MCRPRSNRSNSPEFQAAASSPWHLTITLAARPYPHTRRDFKGIYQECATVLLEEIDYLNEGKNADKFRRNFRGTPWVRVPTIHW